MTGRSFFSMARGLTATVLIAAGLSANARLVKEDTGWLNYRVVDLEERGSDSIKLSPEIDRVIGFRARGHADEWEGSPVYVMDKEDRIKEGNQVHWKFVLDPDGLWLKWMERKTLSPEGRTIANSWRTFRDPAFPYPKKLCHIFTINAAIMAMDLKVGYKSDIYLLLTEDASPWHMFMEVTKEEQVTVPAGTFMCYLLTLKPDYNDIMGKWSWASPLIDPFVPDYYFWVEKADPHNLIKFVGRFGPVGASPQQAYELTGMEPAKEGEGGK